MDYYVCCLNASADSQLVIDPIFLSFHVLSFLNQLHANIINHQSLEFKCIIILHSIIIVFYLFRELLV